MSPAGVIEDLEEALKAVGRGEPIPQWKGQIHRAVATIHRVCAPSSPYIRAADRVGDSLSAVGHGGILGPGWDQPRYDIEAVLHAVLADARAGSLWRGLWDAKNETCSDVLDQAHELAAMGFHAAAAVLAGGALEAHLKDLCARYRLGWFGSGSISKYDSAIASARNNGSSHVYDLGDTKRVTAWGGTRNEAAHDPKSFSGTKDLVDNMIQGIREFIARIP